MPIYEYEPKDRECLMCDGRIEVLQSITDDPLDWCPHCGLAVRKLISKATIVSGAKTNPDAAAKKGFSTYRKTDPGKYEKIAGEGPSMLDRGD